MNEKDMLEWIIANRGEPECEELLAKLAEEMDADTVENCRICIQFDESDAELTGIVVDHLKRKYRHEVRRSRKIAENKEHLRKIGKVVA